MTELESAREQDGSCCAHLTVKFQTKEENGLTQGWWECMSGCGVKFWPIGVSPDGEKIKRLEGVLAEINAKYAALCDAWEEIAQNHPEEPSPLWAKFHMARQALREMLGETE